MITTNLIADQIIRGNPDLTTDKYSVIALKNATGVCYITNGSPQFISGHLRLKGRNNGSYPYNFKEVISELFGSIPANEEEIEVCSGTINKFNSPCGLTTVDINPEKEPHYIMDAQSLHKNWTSKFARWNCDPPYSLKAAQRMYSLKELLSLSGLLIEGARVTKPGGLLFLLLGAKNMQWCPNSLIRIGWIGITIVPNQEIRALHCYVKKVHSL
jgi:hypothetical protein